jgi:hypothetical protein
MIESSSIQSIKTSCSYALPVNLNTMITCNIRRYTVPPLPGEEVSCGDDEALGQKNVSA